MEAEDVAGPDAVRWFALFIVLCVLVIATILFLQTRDLGFVLLGGLISVAILGVWSVARAISARRAR